MDRDLLACSGELARTCFDDCFCETHDIWK
jgi:hypothetical protein